MKEYTVIGVAIGFIVGSAGKDFVDALVRGIIFPFFQVIFSHFKLSHLNFEINGIPFTVGNVANTFLTLLIILVVLYFLVKRITKEDRGK
jgi:large-conductance mechanosensitive channel